MSTRLFDVIDVGLEVAHDGLGTVDQALQSRTQATDRLSGLVQQHRDLVGRQGGQTGPQRRRRPDLAGERCAFGDGLPGGEVLVGSPGDTRSRYCSPTADTECTLAMESTGTLYLSLMLIVARTPVSVGSTSVTLPT